MDKKTLLECDCYRKDGTLGFGDHTCTDRGSTTLC